MGAFKDEKITSAFHRLSKEEKQLAYSKSHW
jgi:hypothetical protein